MFFNFDSCLYILLFLIFFLISFFSVIIFLIIFLNCLFIIFRDVLNVIGILKFVFLSKFFIVFINLLLDLVIGMLSFNK